MDDTIINCGVCVLASEIQAVECDPEFPELKTRIYLRHRESPIVADCRRSDFLLFWKEYVEQRNFAFKEDM